MVCVSGRVTFQLQCFVLEPIHRVNKYFGSFALGTIFQIAPLRQTVPCGVFQRHEQGLLDVWLSDKLLIAIIQLYLFQIEILLLEKLLQLCLVEVGDQ